MRMRYFAVAVLALAACKPAAETPDQAQARMAAEGDSVKAGVTQMDNAFAEHMKAGHADSVAAFYADNASLMAPNMPAAHGAAAIKAALTSMLAQGKPTAFTLTPQEVSANGPMAIERGRYVFGSAMGVDSGKYLVHWHKIGGTWKIVDDIWNSDNPAMPMPAAPARGARRS